MFRLYPVISAVYHSFFRWDGFVAGIPDGLLDAADIDGGGELQSLFRIVLPLSTPIVFTVAIMNTLSFWNEYI